MTTKKYETIEDRGSQITFSALGQQAPIEEKKKEMIFIGDALFPGGNDYPAELAGVVSIRVRDPNESKRVIEAIVACLDGVQQIKPRDGNGRYGEQHSERAERRAVVSNMGRQERQ
jgi:hypothetical protein